MLEINYLLICFFAVFVGGILQGCLGFGFAFIALPVFALFFAPSLATPMIVSLSLILNFIVILSCFKQADKKVITGLLVGGIAGTPLGTLVLQHVDPSSYSLLVGILIISAAGIFLFDIRYPLKDKMMNYLPVGFVSGVLNASIGLSGPPVVLFMSNQAFGKDVMRATLIGYFLMINIIAISWFIFNRLVTYEMIAYMGYFVPAVIAGTLIGVYVSRFIEEKLFRKIMLVCVIVIGLVVSVNSLI